MPEYKTKDQTFKLWKNKYKEDGDKKPDYTGNGLINNQNKDIALWINQDKNGNDYLSFVIKDAEEDGAKPIGVPSPPPVESKPKEEVDLPF